MKLNVESLKNNKSQWEQKGFELPQFDIESVRAQTAKTPEWVHFGAGNIFRGYIACLADELIKNGEMSTGIIAADTFDTEMLDRIYPPFDDLALLVGLRAQGDKYLRVIAGISDSVGASGEGLEKLKTIAKADSLKMISFTITEKGYATRSMSGEVFGYVQQDIDNGPDGSLNSAMSVIAAMMLGRFEAGAKPIALVSMDNCSRNGEKLREGVMFVAEKWREKGFVSDEFIAYLSDSSRVSFPWSMIDKITPRPDDSITKELADMGIEDMQPIITAKKTFIAPFVNAEMPQYLVIEDSFPNGRPPLEKAGVYMTDRETVDRAEKMKVMTCLNPLHTALAVFGCLLGFDKISAEMNDPDLKDLVYKLGYVEGLPVVIDPVIIRPEAFLREVLEQRLPNPYLPDTPQRIATDTSQKLAIRFGETIKAYEQKNDTAKLELIPLVIAAWIRYLTGISDSGEPMELSPDPMLEELSRTVDASWFGKTADRKAVESILGNTSLFGSDLVKAGLSDKICAYLDNMLSGSGAVRKTLTEALAKVK